MASGGIGPGRSRAGPRRDPVRQQRRSEWLRVGLFLASVLLVMAMFVFTNLMANRLSREVTTTSRVLARLCAQASFPAARDPELQAILADVISGIDFPIVITDIDSLPRAWRNVGLDPALVPDQSVDSLAAGRAIAPAIRARIERVRSRAMELDRVNPPIVMTQPETAEPLGRLHFGDPPVLGRMRWVPPLTVGGLGLLIVLGVWGLAGIRRAERRSIWVGMARETAHQLATPLSSLMGWLELLRSRVEPEAGCQEVRLPRAELAETLDDMQRDVERLNKVTQRFSHVGSAPRLELQDVAAVVRQAVRYAARRLPGGEGEATLQERYAETPPVPLNRELLEWAIENLLSNAATALDKRPGRIEVWVEPRRDGRSVEIGVRDNGRGMTLSEQRRAFEPGYTTKPRGWGLGLALTRRVVQDYHGGRLAIRKSAPGEGTTVVISLPA